MINTGGGRFDPAEENVYFIASNVERMKFGAQVHDHILIAVNELNTDEDFHWLETWIKQKKKVFIDSGVYNLATTHAKAHNLTMDQALSMPPTEVDGFNDLLKKYLWLIEKYGDDVWGYIEIDQGGRENKIKTRASLEAKGLRPIPVYHPLNDGWDYFDYLAQNYDRICFGNVVHANRQVRLRLLATMWERHAQYPNLWIHILGLTPNQVVNAYPSNSADSSSWLSAVRWSGYKERAMGCSLGDMPTNWKYQLGCDSTAINGSQTATKMSGYGSFMIQQNWRNHMAAMRREGMVIYEPVE